MRQTVLTIVALIGVGPSAFASGPAPKALGEVIADKDVSAATARAVTAAMRRIGPWQASVVLRAHPAGGVVARVRVAAEASHRDLTDLLDALRRPDVREVTIAVEK